MLCECGRPKYRKHEKCWGCRHPKRVRQSQGCSVCGNQCQPKKSHCQGRPRTTCSDACHRRLRNGINRVRRDVCSCGGTKIIGSRQCVRCQRPAAKKRCTHCGVQIQKRQRRTCSDACLAARREYVATKRRTGTPTLRAQRRRSNAKRRATGWKNRPGRWRTICERDNWRCWICKEAIDPLLMVPDKRGGTADHVVPLSKGGADTDANLRAAHHGCNSRRGAGRFGVAA